MGRAKPFLFVCAGFLCLARAREHISSADSTKALPLTARRTFLTTLATSAHVPVGLPDDRGRACLEHVALV